VQWHINNQKSVGDLIPQISPDRLALSLLFLAEQVLLNRAALILISENMLLICFMFNA
jgi:hypothetical protein